MKQTRMLFVHLMLFFSLAATAQTKQAEKVPADTTAKPPKLLVVQGDLEAFNALFDALDRSDDSHQKIEAIKKWLLAQLSPQVQKKEPPKK